MDIFQVREEKEKCSNIFCSFTLDEMSIKKHMQFRGINISMILFSIYPTAEQNY